MFINSLCFKPTAIAINETYLRNNDVGHHDNLKGYRFISNCRKTHKGGGVGLYTYLTLQILKFAKILLSWTIKFLSLYLLKLNAAHDL